MRASSQTGATQLELRERGARRDRAGIEFDRLERVFDRLALFSGLGSPVCVQTVPASFEGSKILGAPVGGSGRLQETLRVKQQREPAVGFGIASAATGRLLGGFDIGAGGRFERLKLRRRQDRDADLVRLGTTGLPGETGRQREEQARRHRTSAGGAGALDELVLAVDQDIREEFRFAAWP